MVRGRLIAINGKPVSPDNYKKADAKRLVDREFNLSYTTELPGDNRVVDGDWYGTSGKPQVSIEQGLAKLIHVKLGDTLRFDVAGLQVEGARHERAQARLELVQGQLLRADAARRPAGSAGDVHHEFPFAAGAAGADRRR